MGYRALPGKKTMKTGAMLDIDGVSIVLTDSEYADCTIDLDPEVVVRYNESLRLFRESQHEIESVYCIAMNHKYHWCPHRRL